MKSIKTALLIGAALAVFSSAGAFAQAAASAPAMAMSASAPTAHQMRKSNRAANRMLARKVRAAITAAKPTIPMEDFFVFARGGQVTLVGDVDTTDQSARAVAIAKGVPGVTSVRDRTTLEQEKEQ
jgi:hyperosmotically inducible protein